VGKETDIAQNAINIKNKLPVQGQNLNCVQRITYNLVNGNFFFHFPLEPLLSCFRNPDGFMTNIPFIYIILLLFTAIGFSPGGSSPYTSTHNTNVFTRWQ
jgi:hypothetical protein